MKVLIISGHPHLDRSIANISILNEFKKLPDVTIRDIGGLYPDYNINVAEEQKFLLEADVIVWQFPVYWYGMPSIMKKMAGGCSFSRLCIWFNSQAERKEAYSISDNRFS